MQDNKKTKMIIVTDKGKGDQLGEEWSVLDIKESYTEVWKITDKGYEELLNSDEPSKISEENIIDTVSLFTDDKTFESLKEIENETIEFLVPKEMVATSSVRLFVLWTTLPSIILIIIALSIFIIKNILTSVVKSINNFFFSKS